MRAIVITEPGGPEVLQIQEVPDLVAADGEVLIRVRAFGVNHAETHMRKGEWPEATPISGIEAVGTVVADPSGTLAEGTKVITIMGGLGKSRNGSYAEYSVAPASNVVRIETSLGWADLAAIPESYATGWLALRGNLDLQAGDSLLVRGATSALSQAAVNIASDLGARVYATTRREDRATLLRSLGAEDVVIETGAIAEAVRRLVPGGADKGARPRREQRAARLAPGGQGEGQRLPGRLPRRPRPGRQLPSRLRHAERRPVQLLRELRSRRRLPDLAGPVPGDRDQG